MRFYGVKEVAELSGVSVRTLHHYDKIGLLKPASRSEVGYRHYGEQELLRLQQILFYKELGFPLKGIREILDKPGFGLVDALEKHKLALKARRQRISTLLVTIDKTIQNLKKGEIMTNPEKLYEGLPKEVGTTYRQEIIGKYGREVLEQSEQSLIKLKKKDFQQLTKEQRQIASELYALRNENPESESVQRMVARHYENIRMFWGTSNSPDKQAEAYAGLGGLYVSDERFTAIDSEPQPEYARFLQKAMRHFADTQLK